MTVEVASRAPDGWDDLVRQHPAGTPFHLAAWSECVACGLGARAIWIVARRGGVLAGGLPLHHVRSALFGSRLASTPQAAYGGPLAEDDAARAALIERAVGEADRLRVGHLELRLASAPPETMGTPWSGSDLHVTIGGPIAATDDEILKAIPKKTRADCRKADERLTADESPQHFAAFRRLFAENQRDLGTPVLPARFLRAVAEAPDLGARVLLVRDGETPVAACLSLTFRERVLPYWAGAARSALPLHPNHALYLNDLRFARRAGFTFYDFGRSKRGSGSYAFKSRWGFAETPLAYRYRLVRATALPGLNPQNPRYRRAIVAWQRLPLWAADLVGPALSPGLS